MTSTKQLIDTFHSYIPLCQIERAFEIERSLNAGASYLSLGGRKIRSSPSFIRFRLGRGLRFVWQNSSDGLHPKAITTRQEFERILKQIHKTGFNEGNQKMAKKITPADNAANMSNPNKGTRGTNRQYDQNQGNRGKQMNPNQQGKNEANMSNANKGTSGTNRQYDQNQGNRGKQMNPNQQGKK
ncbi:hypothetical protein RND59_16590 [Vibrio ruber]|uniref:hypothetical protein n=1 Tax=Vibrio ruber TaxID=184755 RepID=UPI002893368A|nr:hypothetical protein [Vibrio ruber]WNJ97744.1 hypothetical protein RND59_16590 [Vibrio ruber]